MNQQPSSSQPNQSINIQHSSNTGLIGQAGRDLAQIYGEVVYITLPEFRDVSGLLGTPPVSPPKPLTQEEYRQRQDLLKTVKQSWIEGVLGKSLHNRTLIALGLKEQCDTVHHPHKAVEEFLDPSGQSLPPGTGILDVFNRIGAERTLLILGEPGSGKTTMLLKLAQSMVERTEVDISQPIPVVFNLSSWAGERQMIADWLVKELNSKYLVSKRLSKAWIESQDLILLLDGLDEVKNERRNACVKAINEFRQTHGQTQIIVCSRIGDYEALSNRLRLDGAICIQSLTLEQVNQYLDKAGTQLEILKTLLEEDTALQELAKSPLMLSVMMVTYQGVIAEDVPKAKGLEERKKQLFDAYIERMFKHGGIARKYPRAKVMAWLTYLAQRMMQESQTIFLIERMQPTWLTRKQTWIYRISVVLTVGLLIVLAVLLAHRFGDRIPGGNLIAKVETHVDAIAPILLNDRLMIASIGLIAGLIVGLKRTIEPIETLKWSWARAWSGLLVGLRPWSIAGLKYGFYSGLIIGLIGTAIAAQFLSTPMKNPALEMCSQVGLIAGAIAGVVAGITVGVIAEPHVWLTNGFHPLKPRLKRAAICGLIAGLSVGLGYGLLPGIAAALSLGSIAGLNRGTSDRLVFRLANGLVVGLTAGLAIGLGNGAVAWLVGVLLLKVLPNGLFTIWLSNGLSVGATAGLLWGLIARLKEKTQPVAARQGIGDSSWLIQSLRQGLMVGGAAALVSGVVLGLLLGWHNLLAVRAIALLTNRLGLGLVYVLIGSPFAAILGAISGVMAGGELGALIGGLSGGLRGLSIEQSAIPNQGIWRSARYVGIFSLIGGLTLGLIFGLTNLFASVLYVKTAPHLGDWLHFWLVSGLLWGILSGLISGAACIQHFILRVMLWRNGSIPWNYARFLDYATARIFLQKVGGGYIFIHRLVLEHFAQRPIQE